MIEDTDRFVKPALSTVGASHWTHDFFGNLDVMERNIFQRRLAKLRELEGVLQELQQLKPRPDAPEPYQGWLRWSPEKICAKLGSVYAEGALVIRPDAHGCSEWHAPSGLAAWHYPGTYSAFHSTCDALFPSNDTNVYSDWAISPEAFDSLVVLVPGAAATMNTQAWSTMSAAQRQGLRHTFHFPEGTFVTHSMWTGRDGSRFHVRHSIAVADGQARRTNISSAQLIQALPSQYDLEAVVPNILAFANGGGIVYDVVEVLRQSFPTSNTSHSF